MDRRIQAVINRMQSNPATEFSELAALVNLSPSRLRHLFKVEAGQTPRQFLRELRLQRAEVLLRTTFLTVKEIASQLGLANSTHFVSDFKKVYGVSPAAYRLLNRPSNNRRNNKK